MSSPVENESTILSQSVKTEVSQLASSPFAMSSCLPNTTCLTPDAPEWTPQRNEGKGPAHRSLSSTGVFISLSDEAEQKYLNGQAAAAARVPSAPLNAYSGSKEPDVLHIASLLNNLNASSSDVLLQSTQGLMMEDLMGGAHGGAYMNDQAETLAARLISQLQDNAISNPALLLQHLLGFAPEDYNDLVTALSESGCNYIEIVAAYLHNIKVQAQENGGGSSSSPGVASAARQVVVNKYDYLINELNRFKSMKDPATNLLSVARMATDYGQVFNPVHVGSPAAMFDMHPPFAMQSADSPLSHSPRFVQPPFQSGTNSPRLPAFMQSPRQEFQHPLFLDAQSPFRPSYPAPPSPNSSCILPPSLPASTLPVNQVYVSQQ